MEMQRVNLDMYMINIYIYWTITVIKQNIKQHSYNGTKQESS